MLVVLFRLYSKAPQVATKAKKQLRKFVDAARAAQASEDVIEFDHMLGEIAKAPPPETVQDRKPQKVKKPAK
jgi:uncharacterized protein HemY